MAYSKVCRKQTLLTGSLGDIPRTMIQPICPQACPGRISGSSPLDSAAGSCKGKVQSYLLPFETNITPHTGKGEINNDTNELKLSLSKQNKKQTKQKTKNKTKAEEKGRNEETRIKPDGGKQKLCYYKIYRKVLYECRSKGLTPSLLPPPLHQKTNKQTIKQINKQKSKNKKQWTVLLVQALQTSMNSSWLLRVQNIEYHVHGIRHKFDVRVSSSSAGVVTKGFFKRKPL